MKIRKVIMLCFCVTFLFTACAGDIKPVLKKEISSLDVAKKIPLKAALFIPEDSRKLNMIEYPGCISSIAPTPYGEFFKDAATGTISQIFQAVTPIRNFNDVEGGNFDVVVKADFKSLNWFAACALDNPDHHISAKGSLSVLDPGGAVIWKSDHIEQTFPTPHAGSVQNPDQDVGNYISRTIKLLTEKWAKDIINTPNFYALVTKHKLSASVAARMDRPQKIVSIDDKVVPSGDIIEPTFSENERILGESDIAVVIGIEKYQDLPRSDYSASDAPLVRKYLLSLGIKARNIELLLNERATQSSIRKTIETWLPNRVKRNSRVFVYFSGHGAPDTSTGEAFLVPFDGDPNYLADTGYSLRRLYRQLGKLNAKEIVVVIDSCFSGSGGRSVLAKGARPLVMMAPITELSPNMAVLSATQGTQISTSSQEKGHGIFTYFFLKALKDGKKNLVEIYEYIKPQVEDEAKQLNVQQSPSLNPGIDKIKGRFSLRK